MTQYTGMNRHTGKKITDVDHIRQSCSDILTNRVGTRTKRRDYGSIIPELIDHPNNPVNRLRVMAATVLALTKWEPRIAVTQVNFGFDMTGAAIIDMEAVRIGASGSEINSIPLTIKI